MEIRDLKQSLSDAQAQRLQADQDLEEARLRVSEEEKNVARLVEEKSAVRKEVEDSKKKIEEMKAANTALQEKLKKLREESTDLTHTAMAAQEKLEMYKAAQEEIRDSYIKKLDTAREESKERSEQDLKHVGGNITASYVLTVEDGIRVIDIGGLRGADIDAKIKEVKNEIKEKQESLLGVDKQVTAAQETGKLQERESLTQAAKTQRDLRCQELKALINEALQKKQDLLEIQRLTGEQFAIEHVRT